MASKSKNGNSPLGSSSITGAKGLDAALGALSGEIGQRTPRQSMTAGSKQVHNGVFHAPKRMRSNAKLCAYEPVFFTQGESFYVSVAPSMIGSNSSNMGTHGWKVPELGNSPIVNPDPDDEDWEAPKQSVTTGDWEMWLVERTKKCEVIIQQPTGDPPFNPMPPLRSVWKIATWKVAGSGGDFSVSDLEYGACAGIEHTPTLPVAFAPVVWFDDEEGESGEHKVFFQPAYLLDKREDEWDTIEITVNGSLMTASTGEAISDGDQWWVEIDDSGSTLTADLQRLSSEPTDDDEDIYWVKVGTVSIDSDGESLLFNAFWTGNIEWQPYVPATHPWKVTDGGNGNVDIAAGHILGMYLYYSSASPNSHPSSEGSYVPDNVVLGPGGSYAGGSTSIAATSYIYAEIPRNGTPGSSNEYAESMDTSDVDVGVELVDDIAPSESTTATIVTSTLAPASYAPSTDKAAVCIAKVTNTSGEISVDEQYVTHNPTLFLPVVDVLVVAEIT